MKSQSKIKRSIPALGTFFEITYVQQEGLDEYITDIFKKVKGLEKKLSYFDESGALYKYNKLGVLNDGDLMLILKICKILEKKSRNIFNPKIPGTSEIDLGGIAKGFIVDKISKILIKDNITAVVNAGGDLRVFGNCSEPIYIRDPFDFKENIYIGEYSNISIASSCISKDSYDRGGKSKIYIDSEIIHCSIIGKNCTICDALTKVTMIDPEISFDILNELKYLGIVIDKNGLKYTNN